MNGCIVVVGYDRPGYFEKMLNFLILNEEVITTPVYFCIDGGGAQLEYHEIINRLQDKVKPNKWVTMLQAENLGIGNHLFTIREHLFFKLGYDYITVIEEDVYVSPYFIRLNNQLLEWCSANFDNVPVVSAWSLNFLSKEQKESNLQSVIATNDHWITYTMTKLGWEKIRDMVMEYRNTFLLGIKYKQRDDVAIKKWLQTKRDIIPKKTPKAFPGYVKINFDNPRFATSQDGIMAAAMYLQGLVKVNTWVNRCLYFGEFGEHGTPENFKAKKFSEMTLGFYPEDKLINSFIPIPAVWEDHKLQILSS